MKKQILICRILLFLSFLFLWQISVHYEWIDKFYFSSPLDIIALLIHKMQDSDLSIHISITLIESGISFLLIILLSISIATLFWFFPFCAQLLEPTLVVLNSLPKSALAPLFIVWLGTGSRTIIICGISVGLFGCTLNLYQSFLQTDPERIKLIKTLGGNQYHAFSKVVFPSNIPTLLSLAKVNIGLALVGVIIGEFLAGKQGLGFLIIYGSQVFQLDLVILSIVILCLISMLLYWSINSLEQYIRKKFNT